jgi:glyoxylase-like metal-dependent hydrolase (beta-lactamase superfamily II)
MSTPEPTTATSPDLGARGVDALPDYAPVPRSALGPALNDQGYYVGRVERNLYWVTDGTYQAAFLTTPDGVVLFDAPPTIGHNLQRAIDEVAAANGVSNTVTHLVYSHHHADHAGASSLFDPGVVRIGHEETRRLLLRDDDPARPPNEETFQDRRTLDIGGERIELAWHGANHSPDNILIHLPDHDTLMLIDIVNPGWAPVYLSNLTEDIPGYLEAPANALAYSREHRAAREPRSSPATVSLPRRHRRQRATAIAPRVDIGAAAARRRDRDPSRTGPRPNRRDHNRRNRTSPRCSLLPRRRVRTGGRLPRR